MFMSGLQETVCSLVRQLAFMDLNIPNFHALDDQLAKVIEGMPQLKEFGAIECQFGPLSFTALRPQFRMLRRLDIAFSDTPTGPMIPEILASCPQLEYLCADDVMSEDIIDSEPWVCGQTLKALYVRFCITARYHQQDVFKKISQLPHLESLVFFGLYRETGSKGMEFRLGAGLEHLTTLKELKELSLFDAGDYLRASDIEWMLGNWKKLQLFHGALNTDVKDELVAMFKDAHIQYIG
ncbi:MAG: hypothetical protein J3Q66DRAFT_405008 [Benniella sp.]|nr:MAG: hypothetical protein J3Q66DRAFT_405008 [Benniella sp.]